MENRGRSALIGAAACGVILVFLAALFAFVGGRFKSGYEVDATFARAGQLLRTGSDVKMRGVLVGSVRAVEVTDSGRAVVTLLMHNDQRVPADVSAAIRAKTLFGEKFIDLIPSKGAVTGRLLAAGDEIPLSKTIPPIEVETILEKGVPILEAVDPEAFGGALAALAEGLVGNEEGLRNATVQSAKLLSETERTLPNLERNLVHLKNFAAALNATDTDLLNALEGLTLVGEAIRKHPDAFDATVEGLVPLTRDLADVVIARESDLSDLADKQLAVLQEVRERKEKLPGIVKVLDGFLGVWVADLSSGPYWRISVTDPPVVLGEPYGPGEAPAPRAAVLASLRTDTTFVDDILQVLLAPVPDEDLPKTTAALKGLLPVFAEGLK